jgi:hypothetical protein
MTHPPQTVSEMFPSRYLSAAELRQAVTLRVAAVAVEQFRQPDGDQVWKPVIAFVTMGGQPTQKQLVANKTQCHALAVVAGTERFDKWPGTVVTLSPGRAPNGKETIVVSSAGG